PERCSKGFHRQDGVGWHALASGLARTVPLLQAHFEQADRSSCSQFGQVKTLLGSLFACSSLDFFLRSLMIPSLSSVWTTLPLSSWSKRTMSLRCSLSLRNRWQISMACVLLRSKPE